MYGKKVSMLLYDVNSFWRKGWSWVWQPLGHLTTTKLDEIIKKMRTLLSDEWYLTVRMIAEERKFDRETVHFR
jgi:hypothetical protein